MRSDKRRRLAALERSSSDLARSASGEPVQEIALIDAVLAGLRDGSLRYAGGQWLAQALDYGEVASELNAMSADQPGAVVVALREAEFAEAIEALEAGRFAFLSNSPPYDQWQPKDARTGSPILCAASWPDRESAALASAVHQAAYFCHAQTGAPMPATLAEFGAWLRELRHLAICDAQP